MRVTGARRHARHGRGVRYQGSPGKPSSLSPQPYVLPEDEGGVWCEACKTWVAPRASDPTLPCAHAPGGARTNIKRGLMMCEGAKSPRMRVAEEINGLKVYDPAAAKAAGLVTLAAICKVYNRSEPAIRKCLQVRGVPATGILVRDGEQGYRHLFKIEDVTRVLPRMAC